MKRILITGENSYIGNMFTEWIKQWPNNYTVDEISVCSDEWKKSDFSVYDVVFHLAAIVHRKETTENMDLYFKVNRDLAYKVARKAKDEGVNQFIFMSTMNVYGVSSGVITEETSCVPKTAYGKSKLEAEKLINSLQSNDFCVAIVRPPMVYGPKTVGNYVRLSKLARNFPLFPKIQNKRSMIYINNLSEFIRLLVDNNQSGVFYPQNKEYVSTHNLVKEISKFHSKKIYTTQLFNPLLYLFRRIELVEKIFGNLVYHYQISNIYDLEGNKLDYQVANFVESVRQTENEN